MRKINIRNNTFILIIALMLAMSCFIVPGTVYAEEGSSNENGVVYTPLAPAAVVFAGSLVMNGNGFINNYVYLTQGQLDGIVSEPTADVYFQAPIDSYLDDVDYSGRRRVDDWRQETIKGLNLKAVAQSLGVSTATNIVLNNKSSDGYTSSLSAAFTTLRYCFPAGDAVAGTAVDPALALSGIYKSDGDTIEGTPKVIFGQTSAVSDYNMQNWGKWISQINFGPKDTALTINNNGTKRSLSIADVIGSKSGRFTSVYSYTDQSESQKNAAVTGIPLDKLLSDANIKNTNKISVKVNGGEKTVSSTELSKYFVVYEGGYAENSSGSLQLYGPGTTESEVVGRDFTEVIIGSVPPGMPANFKVQRQSFNSIKLSWTKVTGADGYYIFRYNTTTKKYDEIDDTMNGNITTYINNDLSTNTKYSYKIRAYKIIGSAEVYGAYTNEVSAVPTMTDPVISKIKKSGKKNVKVSWKKVDGAQGYVVYRATKKNGQFKKIGIVKKSSALSYTNKKLKKGQKYYFKIKAYRSVNGKQVLSSYSNVKSIRR